MKIGNKSRNDLILAIVLVLVIVIFAGVKEGFLINSENGGFFNFFLVGFGKGNVNESLGICEESYGFEPIIYFCPKDDCFLAFSFFVNESYNLKCAFYDLDEEIFEIFDNKADEFSLIKTFEGINGDEPKDRNSNISLVLEDSNCIDCEFCICDYASALMHNKFCIFNDEVILTGSTNPTKNGFFKNNNNMIIIKSKCLAKSFYDEFNELKRGILSKGTKSEIRRVIFSDGVILDNYFCPEDGCQKALLNVINGSNEICFATFSFTDEKVAQSLIDVKLSGGEVFGTIEKRNANSLGSVFSLLNRSIDVRVDSNPNSMHHKIFVIDKKIVVTGSYNPTKNGNTRNDENMIIIYDNETAIRYYEECINVYESGV
ncbi:MAG TPA: phospholipase D-like domain-containing protein [Candidatus Woesearchaeota archaeon]|nr:phospholipase D-like domain-containing protein [Candidatus Woesearchaeota archaeon]